MKSAASATEERFIRPSSYLFVLYLAAMALYSAITLISVGQWLHSMTILTVVFFCAFSLAHLIEMRGWLAGLTLAGSAFLITLSSEALGVATGFPFGHYTYAEHLGPKAFGLVPLIIPVAWFMVLYPAYVTTGFLFNRLAPARLQARRRVALVIRAALGALAMTAWDLSLDPRMVASGYWTWPDGGPYFGVPLSNFAGWLMTSFLIYMVWGAVEYAQHRLRGGLRAFNRPTTPHRHAMLPVLAYIVTWIGESAANVLFWSGPLVGLMVFGAMGLFAAPALLLLIQPALVRLAGASRSWSSFVSRW